MQAEPLLATGQLVALGGEPVTSALYWQVARASSTLLEGLTEVLAAARRELVQG